MKKGVLSSTTAIMVSAVSSMWAPTVCAQVAAPPPESGSTAELGTAGIQDIVVTARRTNESAQSIPLAISVIGSQKIKDANVSDITDVARLTPNFNVRVAASDPTSTLMTIRGQSQQDSILTTTHRLASTWMW